ncbi:programmed cell death 1 ligand 1-like [Scomber japonicus]|uniref:programmed cell death 1 ligand 1-like n=1 Tax=Scomber japonicus TaxID=13676 RepID=UPI002305D392|nr:programmed cell death 1 ligand 1-like [Scomber japonicus]
MELLPLVCVSLLTWSGTTFAAENEPKVIRVKENGTIILPCSLSSKQDISSQLFDWRKDHRKADEKQVFQYNGRDPSNIIITNKDKRVSHFPDKLKSGDASITIRNTKVADSGVYTCIFPDLNPEQIFHMKLIVGDLKDRTGENIPGSALKPYIISLKETKDWARLQCEAHGNPQPELLWQDSDGNNLKAEEPQVSTQGDQFNVTLQITVNKTDLYRCVATQDEIRHQIYAETHKYIHDPESITDLYL